VGSREKWLCISFTQYREGEIHMPKFVIGSDLTGAGKLLGSDVQSFWRKLPLTANLCVLLLCILGVALLLGCRGEEAAGPACDVLCICTGLPGRPPGSGICNECNPFGEVWANPVLCPSNVAIGGICNIRITSSNPTALAIQLPDHQVSPPQGAVISPTVANLVGGASATQVTVTFTRLNDNFVFARFVYTVRNNCRS